MPGFTTSGLPPSHSDQDVIISAPKLEPFVAIGECDCPKCGNIAASSPARFYFWLTGRTSTIHNVAHCKGGRAPVEDIANPIEAMMRGKGEERPSCGGVMEEHLHLLCRLCGYIRLMKTKS